MDVVNHGLAAVAAILATVLGLLLGVFGAFEGWMRELMERAGLPHELQTILLIVLGVAFVVAALRLFGGVLRLLIIVLLILLLLHDVLADGGAGRSISI
jgi:hypothetical protein